MLPLLFLLLLGQAGAYGDLSWSCTVIAGNGDRGDSNSTFTNPVGAIEDAEGNAFIADYDSKRIMKWAPGAKSGTLIHKGSGRMVGLLWDQAGNIIFSAEEPAIEAVNPENGDLTLVAGSYPGSGSATQFTRSWAIRTDAAGTLFVACSGTFAIWRFESGNTSGTVVAGGNGQGGAMNQLNYVLSFDVDPAGELVIADSRNSRILRWTQGASSGILFWSGECNSLVLMSTGDIIVQSNTKVLFLPTGAANPTTFQLFAVGDISMVLRGRGENLLVTAGVQAFRCRPPESTIVAPESTTVAPESTTVAPESTTVAPESTTVAPESTTVTPESTSVSRESAWSELQAFVRQHELDLLAQLAGDPGLVRVGKEVPGAVFAAEKLNASSGRAVVPVGAEASVALPMPALLARLGLDAIRVVAGLVTPFLGGKDAAGRPVEVLSMMSVNVFSLQDEEELDVDRLNETMAVVLPVNHTEQNPLRPAPTCAFWDEASNAWKDLPGQLTWGKLTCFTTHLTFFGAILKGFLDALLCSQFSLYSAESFKRLSVGSWPSTMVASIFWLVLALLAAMMLLACISDGYNRRKGKAWDDENFLIPTGAAGSLQEAAIASSVASEHARSCLSTLSGCGASVRDVCMEGGSCRDVVDELISRWAHWFSQTRAVVERACSGLTWSSCNGSSLLHASQALVDSMVLHSVRRQVAFTLRVSVDAVDFVTTDEDFGALVLQKDPAEAQGAWSQRLEYWQAFHAKVTEEINAHWHSMLWWKLPMAVARLVVVDNPMVAVFLDDCFLPSALRVLLFATEILGAAMVACLFFTASGSARRSFNGGACTEPTDVWEELGRIIAVATASLILAGIPVAVLESLHSRSFAEVDFEGCREWHRRLRMWRAQDKLMWGLGTAYSAFAALTVMLFLANVADDDLPEWGASMATAVVEETLAIPGLLALLMPLATMLLLLVVSPFTGLHYRELLRQRKENLDGAKGNWMRKAKEGNVNEEYTSRVSI